MLLLLVPAIYPDPVNSFVSVFCYLAESYSSADETYRLREGLPSPLPSRMWLLRKIPWAI